MTIHSDDSSSGAPNSTLDHGDKAADQQIERLETNDRVARHGHYEKNGETGEHEHDAPMTTKRILALVAMAFLWTGSQIPVYLFGGVPPYIYRDIGGADRWIWFVLANLLALAAVCPFVGSLSDLIGRRYVAITGACFIILGMIICSTAQTMNIMICGMTFAGIGAGINELTALAATSEMAPTAKRGKYVAILVFTIIPFCPSVLWAQLIAYHSSWRYCGLFCALWAFIGLILTVVFYHPPPRVNSSGMSRKQILGQIDYLGGFLSIAGMLLFMMGMQWGGYQYKWHSAHVVAPLVLGIVLLIAFVFWEAYGAKYPMFPKRISKASSILSLTLVITFISGANFFSILMFWPTQAFNVYGHEPIGVGIRGIPVGFGILAGAFIALWALSAFRGHNKAILIVASILMTAGCGALSIARPDNLYQLWGILIVASLGIGGIVVPASVMSTIVCPPDLIGTITALTLSIRVIGGSIGYCAYYNVFVSKFTPAAIHYIGGTLVKAGIKDPKVIEEAIVLTGASLLEEISLLPGIKGNEALYQAVVSAGQLAYAEAYKWVYYSSVAFGGVSIIAAAFLGDISSFMDDEVAVIM
ncbi:MFS general substrate transporter [Melanomma pulvis-pyrius CBS 109.77]|uniref:MFS general substrate transporter n=1 Tax=Melanomma pulvis-pyrius CBS 109.77 TaxID=1314802 RepID=A0A6A6WZH7_9PLEO|nr:MFS general substrate transporter [Melanomma pulvis-pyrius CBS 109.77]